MATLRCLTAAALNARFPIENPAPEPKQPFSRKNHVGTIGGPIVKDRLWIFSGFEMVNEHASINYSPDSLTQFNALNQLAQAGLIPDTASIGVPPYVRVPYQSYLGMMRFDWAQSQRSQSSCGMPSIIPPPTMRWCSRPPCPLPERRRTPTIRTALSATPSPSVHRGWKLHLRYKLSARYGRP